MTEWRVRHSSYEGFYIYVFPFARRAAVVSVNDNRRKSRGIKIRARVMYSDGTRKKTAATDDLRAENKYYRRGKHIRSNGASDNRTTFSTTKSLITSTTRVIHQFWRRATRPFGSCADVVSGFLPPAPATATVLLRIFLKVFYAYGYENQFRFRTSLESVYGNTTTCPGTPHLLEFRPRWLAVSDVNLRV